MCTALVRQMSRAPILERYRCDPVVESRLDVQKYFEKSIHLVNTSGTQDGGGVCGVWWRWWRWWRMVVVVRGGGLLEYGCRD
jgi:hypothetical protein